MNKWLALVASFAPTILALFGVNPIVGQLVVTGILTEEQVRGSGQGADKKAAVLAGVQSGVAAVNANLAASGKPVLGDPAKAASDVGAAIDLVVAVVNRVSDMTPTPALASTFAAGTTTALSTRPWRP